MSWLIATLTGGLVRPAILAIVALLMAGACATVLPKMLRSNGGNARPLVVAVMCDPAPPVLVAPTTIADLDPALLREFEQWLEDQALMN